jgi:hypothetical protein
MPQAAGSVRTFAMSTSGNRPEDDARRQEEARRILDRAHRDSAPILDSALRRSGDFLAARGESDDPAEIWGKRIGRGLAIAVGIGCVIYLVMTYAR